MELGNFYHQNGDKILFSRQQASRFAKEIANDFNPLHDADAKMFCVPGDLLFSVALERLGLSQQMCFTFSCMVSDKALHFPDTDATQLHITDDNGKSYLTIERHGDITHDARLIDQLTYDYVGFSGKTFPHILVPLMSKQGVMFNPTRPLVLYERMEIHLDRLDLTSPTLESADADFEVFGKKGAVRLDFNIKEKGERVGRGSKHLTLRGLLPFDVESLTRLIEKYNSYRKCYQTNQVMGSEVRIEQVV